MIRGEIHRARSAAGHAHDVDRSSYVLTDHFSIVVAHVLRRVAFGQVLLAAGEVNAVLLGEPFQANIKTLLGGSGGGLVFQLGPCEDDQVGSFVAQFGVWDAIR